MTHHDAIAEVEIRALTAELNTAYATADATRIGELLSDDYFYGGEVLMTKAQEIERVVELGAPRSQTVDAVQAKTFEGSAVLTGVATVVDEDESGTFELRMRWVNGWAREGDAWRVVYSQSTVIGEQWLEGGP